MLPDRTGSPSRASGPAADEDYSARLTIMNRWWRVRRAWVLPFAVATTLITLIVAAAVAAIETDTVESFWTGIWWAISLVTTVGFVGESPTTAAGRVLSVVLMVLGFLLLAMVSAALASLFVHDAEAPRDAREEERDQAILTLLATVRDSTATSPSVGSPLRRTLLVGSSTPHGAVRSRRRMRLALHGSQSTFSQTSPRPHRIATP